MPTNRKFLYVITAAGIALLLLSTIFVACDTRKAVNPKLNVNQQVTLSLTPTNLIIRSQTKPDTVKIDIRVRDGQGNGIDSINVDVFRTPEVGTIVPPGMTIDGGHATGYFITDPGSYDDTLITLIAASGSSADTTLLTMTISLATVSMSLLPPQMVIHSLNKSDSVDIDIRVRDEDGNGIDSVEVSLTRSPSTGTIVPPTITSLGGYTHAIYVTDPGIDEDMQIFLTARSGTAVDVDTLLLLVSLQGEIDTMNVSLGKQTLTADGADFTTIFVSVLDTTGVPIGDNTIIFMDNYGAGFGGNLDSTFTHTQNGVAKFQLIAPPLIDTSSIVDVDSLHAWGISESGDTAHAYSAISYVPGAPASLQITTDPQEMVAGSGEAQEIRVRVSDPQGSFVRNGTQIRFKNQLAPSDITSLTTTVDGYATGIYTVGTQSGIDFIDAFYITPGTTDTLWSDQKSLTVRSSVPTNITLSASDPTIEVGGIATVIYATMQDENGNHLSDGYWIRFEITAAPSMGNEHGPSFEHVPRPDSVVLETMSVTDVNGRASVSLFSGTVAGTVRIKATSIDNENIFKEKAVITIQSGPPYNIEIGPSNLANAIGQSIFTGITAQVWDQYTNPVEPLTAVHFEVTPDTSAYIEGAAYTGGYVNPDDSTDTIGVRGMAETWMSYICYHTFDTVRVVASSGDMADTSEAIVLAIYDGSISVDANPSVLYVDPTVMARSDISALLQDGLMCPIKNGIIIFSVSGCGNLCGQTMDTTEVDGYAYTEFCIEYSQVPPRDPPTLPPACDAKVKARLRGYPSVEGSCDIFCTIETLGN